MVSYRKLGHMMAGDTGHGANATNSVNLTHLPDRLLESFIPGYSLISRFLLDSFGFDVSIVVSLVLILVASATAFQYVSKRAKTIFTEYLTSSISIDNRDEFYLYLSGWVSRVESLQNIRSLRVKSADSGFDGFPVDDDKISSDLADGELFNFSNWEAKIPPRFEPHLGAHWFWYKGNLFKFERKRETTVQDGWGGGVLGNEETVSITVLGRSAEPVKRILMEARQDSLSKESTKTIVRRPSPKELRGRGRQAWMRVAMRPSRPMETVVLDVAQKTGILRDINEFVHPATPRWYANRGIPYRRGYLFHGPPGTGKTSLSFAIAGVFGLDIYCISLLEPTLTEEDLSILFNNLPPRCVVLLEDIDSAGLHRKKSEAEEEDEEEKGDQSKGRRNKEDDSSAIIAKEISKAFKNVNEQTARNNNNRGGLNTQGISLSGLLNAIDGVASPEGRVLVMTTNFPEKLDEALVRPGRIDMKIAFTLATKQQIRELFLRMYTSDVSISKRLKPTKVSDIVSEPIVEESKTATSNGHAVEPQSTSLQTPPPTPKHETASDRPTSDSHIETTVLPRLADSFAAILPENTFSPAEIQGFLLTRKKDPKKAVQEVGRWKDELLESRKKGLDKTIDPSIKASVHDADADTSAVQTSEDGKKDEDELVFNGIPKANSRRERRETVTKINDSKPPPEKADEDKEPGTETSDSKDKTVSTNDTADLTNEPKDKGDEKPEPYELKESLFDGEDEKSDRPSGPSSTASSRGASVKSLGSDD